MGDDRGISTVVDVALALFFITASIAVIGVYMADQGGGQVNSQTDSRTAETLSSTTQTVHYSLWDVRSDPNFNPNNVDRSQDGVTYERSSHGTTASLLADSAMMNVQFSQSFTNGSKHGVIHSAGPSFYKAVDSGLRNTITGMNKNTQIIVVWEPYEEAGMSSRQKYGPSPSPDEDISSTTMTVDSGVPPVDEGELERDYRTDDDFEAVSDRIAARIVEGYFPVGPSQSAIEDQGLTRELTVYRYQRFGSFVGVDYNPGAIIAAGPLTRRGADASEANRDLERGLSNQIRGDLNSTSSYEDISANELSDRVSTGNVKIIVRTW